MKTLSGQLNEARERTYKEVLNGFLNQGYANYGFIHFFGKSYGGTSIKLDYPDLDKKYTIKEIAYCPNNRYWKPGEDPWLEKIDKAFLTGDNENYNQFSVDYGVFWSDTYKYFYFVKLTEKNKKFMDKYYLKSRKTLKEQRIAADKKQQEEERRKAKWAAEAAEHEKNQKVIDEFKKQADAASKEAEKFVKEWEKNPEAFEKMPDDVWKKLQEERKKNKKVLKGNKEHYETHLDPMDLYPYVDIQTYHDPYYGHNRYVRLIKYNNKKYYIEYSRDEYPPGYYWGD